MNLSPKDQTKVAKLLALALDGRGSKKEADAAALKALRICRDANLTVEEFSSIFGTIQGERDAGEPLHSQFASPLDGIFCDVGQSIITELLRPFTGRKRRPTW